MKLGDLKAVLALADKQPINCAFALIADKSAVLLAHRQTAPKLLAKQIELRAKTADKNSLRFGRITVDTVNDAGTLKFAINKREVGGTVTGLLKLARRAGYQAVVLNEDAAPAPPPAAGGTTYDRSRLAWLATRKKIAHDIATLRGAIVDAYKDDGIAGELDRAYQARVAPILSGLDERLADVLAAADKASDPAERAKHVADARTIISDHTSFLARTSTIRDLDANPFVPLSIHDLLSNTLFTLAQAIR